MYSYFVIAGHLDICDLLTSNKKTNMKLPDAQGQTPYMLAKKSGNSALMQLFNREWLTY